MGEVPLRRRRVRIVLGEVQWRIFGVIVGGMLLSLLVSFALALRLLRTIREILAFVPPAAREVLISDAVEAIAFVMMVELLMVSLAGFYGLWMSHRIAGPIYRIETDLARMEKEGRVFPIRTRAGDLLGLLVGRINAVLARFERRP